MLRTNIANRSNTLILACVVLCAVTPGTKTFAQSTPEVAADHQDPTATINHFITSHWNEEGVTPAAPADDATFVRRLYLDLTGRIPTVEERERFLASPQPDKRAQLVDELLASEDYAVHMAEIFDTLLMGRGSPNDYRQRKANGWVDYLQRVFRDNRPWNDVAREILLARPTGEVDQGSVWFLYERNNQHQAIAEAIGPAFFGTRIECAQCHDHPLCAEIEQEHYWGLVAFYRRGTNVKTDNGPRIAESAIGGFEEYANIYGESHPNVLSMLDSEPVAEPRPAPDEKQEDSDDLYRAAAVVGDPRVPIFSRREKFVDEILTDQPRVPSAFVNRIWALLLGRGIIHPFDEMDSMHDASHPELLDWLAEDFTTNNFDIKRLVRAIALSEAYALESLRPEGVDDPAHFAWALQKPLTAEQYARSLQLVLHGHMNESADIINPLREQFAEVLPEETNTPVKNALFLSNNPAFDQFIRTSRSAGHLVPRLMELDTHEARVDTLFQTSLGRAPSEEELTAAVAFLQGIDSLETSLDNLVWAIVTGAEFRFNH